MEYRELVAVTGLGGLYQLQATKADGAIVRSVADKVVKFISARKHNVTPLESIEVYTTGENVRLHEVFKKMQESEGKTPLVDVKAADNTAIKNYFKSIFPEFDEDRVYVSDMKKMVKWYEILKDNDLLRFPEETEGTEEATAAEAPAEFIPDEKPAKKAAKKKAEAEEATAEGEEKPVKKAAKKKKAETEEATADGEEKPAKKTAAKKKKTEE